MLSNEIRYLDNKLKMALPFVQTSFPFEAIEAKQIAKLVSIRLSASLILVRDLKPTNLFLIYPTGLTWSKEKTEFRKTRGHH